MPLLDSLPCFAHYHFLEVAQVPSTNHKALSLAFAPKFQDKPLWVYAKTQTAGRGQYGRHWISAPGNLQASLLCHMRVTREQILELPLLALQALRQALEEGIGLRGGEFEIKSPNDLLIKGRKLAGILVESRQVEPAALAVVIGFGMNVVCAPRGMGFSAASLREFGYLVSRETVFYHLIWAFDTTLKTWLEEK